MNNAKMWLVVKPTVGVPLFLTAVAVGSFAVHVSVLRNTTWLPQFLSGGAAMEQASLQTPGIVPTGGNATVVFDGVQQVGTGQQGVVVLPDGRTARVIFDEPKTVDGTKTALLK